MNKQLLVVDDSPDIHAIVTALLADEPIDVRSATDPAYGLTLAASAPPDLILLDVDMPTMDGYEFCRRLKADAAAAAVPVVFLTSKGDPDQKVRGLHLGAVDYVTKPFSPGELLARVRSALRTQSVIADLEGRSLTDALTGLGNKRQFDARLKAAASERARSPGRSAAPTWTSTAFGQINRGYGQPFGDAVLAKVAEALRATARPEDVACRLRDDDFAPAHAGHDGRRGDGAGPGVQGSPGPGRRQPPRRRRRRHLRRRPGRGAGPARPDRAQAGPRRVGTAAGPPVGRAAGLVPLDLPGRHRPRGVIAFAQT